ncbi:Elongation factor-like GTPase 1 [Binucleata daphniae]
MKKIYITSILAHIDHGKTTLIDSLLATNNIISSSCAGDIRYMDSRNDEQIRGITLKLSVATITKHKNNSEAKNNIEKRTSLKTKSNEEKANNTIDYIIIDTPGHVDFESLIQISNFISSSFVLIIDVNEGITPRIFSLISHMQPNKTLLVLNKIDKLIQNDKIEDTYYHLLGIISKLNDLIGRNVFDWDSDNVVIAWSTMCAGASKSDFTRIIKNGDMINGIKLFAELKKRIETGKIDKIMAKFNIINKNEKNIWMGVMPLANAILDGIERINENKDDIIDIKCNNNIVDISSTNNNQSLVENKPYNLQSLIDDEKFLHNYFEFFGLTMYSILIDHRLIKENVLFVTRIFVGRLRKGDIITCKNKQCAKDVLVESIFIFRKNELVEVDSIDGINIVALKGDFIKQSIMYKKIGNNNISQNNETNNKNSNESTSYTTYNNNVKQNNTIHIHKDIECDDIKHIKDYKANKDFEIGTNNILDDIVTKFTLNNKPFYKSCVTLMNENKQEFVEALKVISYLEPVYKVKRNKYGNFEIFCEGKVQFEKITNDLVENGFIFDIEENTKIFAETTKLCSAIEKDEIYCAIIPKHVSNESTSYGKILQAIENKHLKRIERNNRNYEISKTVNIVCENNKSTLQTLDNDYINILHNKNHLNKTHDNKNKNANMFDAGMTYKNDTNIIYFYDNIHKDMIVSIFEQFINKGPLINEKIHYTQIYMLIDDNYTCDDAFQTIKKLLLQAYMDASCIIIPFYYQCTIRSLANYISQVYSTLDKFQYILQNDMFDEKTEFYVLNTLIPQFLYYQFVEEIRMKSKGTVYLETLEHDFVYNKKADFSYLVNDIRKEKGMFVEEKIVVNPEKQRTLKK